MEGEDRGHDREVLLMAGALVALLSGVCHGRGRDRDSAPDPSSELYEAQRETLTLMIVRGYVARHQTGEPPSIADLSEFARSGLEWHGTPRATFD